MAKTESQILNKPDQFNQGQNYKAVHCGRFEELNQFEMHHPRFGVVKPGKVFLQELIDSTGMEVSINSMPAGKTLPFSHAHKTNEEIFVFIRGEGQMAIDSEIIDVKEGSCVRLAPQAVRCVRNSGDTELCFIVIQAKEKSLGGHTFDDGIEATQELNWTK